MEKFEFKSQICTSIVQSKRLLELGLKKETADMSISTQSLDTDNGIKYSLTPYSEYKYRIMYNIIPAWSLHRLMLIANANDIAFINIEKMYETLIKMIASNIKWGLINKDYLEERK